MKASSIVTYIIFIYLFVGWFFYVLVIPMLNIYKGFKKAIDRSIKDIVIAVLTVILLLLSVYPVANKLFYGNWNFLSESFVDPESVMFYSNKHDFQIMNLEQGCKTCVDDNPYRVY